MGGLDGLLKPAFVPGASALTIATPREVAGDQLRALGADALGATLDAHAADASIVQQALAAILERVGRRGGASLASHAPCVPALAKVRRRGSTAHGLSFRG